MLPCLPISPLAMGGRELLASPSEALDLGYYTDNELKQRCGGFEQHGFKG